MKNGVIFPNEKRRFFDLMVRTKPARPIILSGDRHMAEYSKIELEGMGYPLYEFTSSGLTHTKNPEEPEDNQYRIIKGNFGLIHILHAESDISIKLEVRDTDDQVSSEILLAY